MIPVAGTVGLRILKTLYKGKKMIGSGAKKASKFAADKGFACTSKAITGASKKVHKGTRYLAKEIKKNPKVSSFLAGGLTYNIFDND